MESLLGHFLTRLELGSVQDLFRWEAGRARDLHLGDARLLARLDLKMEIHLLDFRMQLHPRLDACLVKAMLLEQPAQALDGPRVISLCPQLTELQPGAVDQLPAVRGLLDAFDEDTPHEVVFPGDEGQGEAIRLPLGVHLDIEKTPGRVKPLDALADLAHAVHIVALDGQQFL